MYQLAAIILNNLLVEYPIKVLLPRQLIYWCRKKKKKKKRKEKRFVVASRYPVLGIQRYIPLVHLLYLFSFYDPFPTLAPWKLRQISINRISSFQAEERKKKKKEKNLRTVKLKPRGRDKYSNFIILRATDQRKSGFIRKGNNEKA